MLNGNSKKNIVMTEAQKKGLKEQKLRNFRLYTHTKGLRGQDICLKIEDNKKKIKYEKAILNEEDLNPDKKQLKFQKKRRHISGLIPSNLGVSNLCRNILTDAYEKINYMKEYSNFWEKENGKRLQKTTEQFCKGRPYSTNNNFHNLPSPQLMDQLYIHPKKHNKPINYIRYNDSFRRDINRAFQLYNPEINLRFLKELRLENNDVKLFLDEVNDKINLEIEERKKGDFYKKKLQKIQDNYNNFNRPKSNVGNFQKTHSTNFNSVNSTKNNFFNLKKKKKIDYKERELELMEDALEPLFNSLEIAPIVKYIDDTVRDKKRDINQFSKKQKDYFPKLSETEKAIQKIHLNKINLDNEKMTDSILHKVNDEQINLIKDLENSKEILLNDIHN